MGEKMKWTEQKAKEALTKLRFGRARYDRRHDQSASEYVISAIAWKAQPEGYDYWNSLHQYLQTVDWDG